MGNGLSLLSRETKKINAVRAQRTKVDTALFLSGPTWSVALNTRPQWPAGASNEVGVSSSRLSPHQRYRAGYRSTAGMFLHSYPAPPLFFRCVRALPNIQHLSASVPYCRK
jgi:hypothetical protein